jgi:hypothetical protein
MQQASSHIMKKLLPFIHSRFNSGAWAVVMLVIIEALSAFLSGSLTVGKLTPSERVLPNRVLYGAWATIVVVALLITIILWLVNDRRRLRLAIFVANTLLTGQLFVATLLLVVRLLQSVKITVPVLIGDAIIIFLTNILIFALWYWFIDSANTRFFKTADSVSWDFLFPQRQANYPGYENWVPHFFDYLFLAYSTSVAFSAADTQPLSRASKILMTTQSAMSLIAITAVVGTAINILASSA